MGGFGGSRVSAQPVRAGGRFVRWAGHGRPRKFVLQAHPGLLGIAGALAAPAILAATSESVGARMSPWLVPDLLSRGGAPQAAMPATWTCKPHCLRIWPKSRVHASKEPQTGPWTALRGFKGPVTAGESSVYHLRFNARLVESQPYARQKKALQASLIQCKRR